MKQINLIAPIFKRIFAIMSVIIITAPLLSVHAAQSISAQQQIAISEETISEAELAQIIAPIALYPDSLLTHILIATTYPLELVQANRWVKKHNDIDVSARMQLAENQSWDPSVIALTAFPSVLEKLNDNLDWTQNLGDAFLQDEEAVLAMVQTLRRQADEANSFDDMDNMRVTKVEKQIIIEPAKPEVIYVPYYDTRVVYGNWYWHAYPPVYWYTRPVYAHHRPIYWGPSVYVNFNYFFGSVHWSQRRVVVINHRHSHYYKPSRKIAYSSGAKRWKHQPTHRHGVAYRNSSVSKRYDTPQRYQQHQQARNVRNDMHKVPSRKPDTAPRLHNSQGAYKIDNSPQRKVSQPSPLSAQSSQHNRVSRELQHQKQPTQNKSNDRAAINSSQVQRTQPHTVNQQPAKVARDLNMTREPSRQNARDTNPRDLASSRTSSSNAGLNNQSASNRIFNKASSQVKQPAPRQDNNRQTSNIRQADTRATNTSRQSSPRAAPTRQTNHSSNGTKSRVIER